jgi:hypothetical protein
MLMRMLAQHREVTYSGPRSFVELVDWFLDSCLLDFGLPSPQFCFFSPRYSCEMLVFYYPPTNSLSTSFYIFLLSYISCCVFVCFLFVCCSFVCFFMFMSFIFSRRRRGTRCRIACRNYSSSNDASKGRISMCCQDQQWGTFFGSKRQYKSYFDHCLTFFGNSVRKSRNLQHNEGLISFWRGGRCYVPSSPGIFSHPETKGFFQFPWRAFRSYDACQSEFVFVIQPSPYHVSIYSTLLRQNKSTLLRTIRIYLILWVCLSPSVRPTLRIRAQAQ